MNKLVPSLVVLAIAATIAFFVLSGGVKDARIVQRIDPSDYVAGIPAKGKVDTLKFTSVRAPDCRFSRQIVWLKEEGSHVKKGELIAKFDASDVLLYLEDLDLRTQSLREAEMSNALMWDNTVERIENSIILQGENVSLQGLELDQKKYHAALVRKMTQVALNNEEGVFDSLKSQKERLLQQRKMSDQYDKERMDRHLKNVAETKEMVALYDIYAPFDSVIIYPEIYVAGIMKKAESGDSLVQSQDFARLPDFSNKSLLLYVREHDIEKLKPGMAVSFRVKSYPQLIFEGKLRNISSMASEDASDETRRFFDVVVELDNSSPDLSLLLPGMTVEALIILKKYENVLKIPLDFVSKTPEGLFVQALGADGKTELKELKGAIIDGDFALVGAALFGGGISVVSEGAK